MPELLNEQQQRLREETAIFAHTVLEPRRDFEPRRARAEVVAASTAAGLFPMTQPREFGGTEASILELTVVRDELHAHNAPYIDAVFGPGPGALASAAEPIRSRYLVPLLNGTKRGSFGFTEPDDAPHPTRAVVTSSELIVNGQKSYVTGGADADFISTLVQVDDLGPALVIIDTDMPGVMMENAFSSLDGSHHAAFRFTDVHVPANHVIGEPGQGLPRALRQIGDTRLAIAARCVGTSRWVLDFLAGHLQHPDSSGQPRGHKEGVRLRYAELRIKTFAARSMLYRTARLADSGANVVNEGIACKVFATESVFEVVDMAMQLVGSAALVDGHPLAGLYKQVRALRLAEGGNDVLRLNLARGRLDLDKGVV